MPSSSSSRKDVSHALLGNRHKLDVLEAIASAPPGEWVFARAISDASGVRENQVGAIVKKLVAAGVLEQMTFPSGGGQPIQYQRVGEAFWQAVEDLVTAVESMKRD